MNWWGLSVFLSHGTERIGAYVGLLVSWYIDPLVGLLVFGPTVLCGTGIW